MTKCVGTWTDKPKVACNFHVAFYALFCICVIQYLKIWRKLFCTLLHPHQRMHSRYVHSSLMWYPLATRGNVVFNIHTAFYAVCCVCVTQYLEIWCKVFFTLLYPYQRVCLRYVCSSPIWYSPATGGNGVKLLFQLYWTKYLEIWCKAFCILLYLYHRVCLRNVHSSPIWYPPATGGNLVKLLFQLYQTQ